MLVLSKDGIVGQQIIPENKQSCNYIHFLAFIGKMQISN